jgi:hypothetical protein
MTVNPFAVVVSSATQRYIKPFSTTYAQCRDRANPGRADRDTVVS